MSDRGPYNWGGWRSPPGANSRYFRVVKVAFAVLLILHGLAHAPGVLGSWRLATLEDASYAPNILLVDASEMMVALLGVIWLIAGSAFVIAGIGLLRRATWWAALLVPAVSLSLGVTTLWWEDATIGLALNGVIVAVLLGRRLPWAARSHARTR